MASARVDLRSQILLATAWVRVSSSNVRSVDVRALLDQGSEVTFISENVAQMLRSPRVKLPIAISAVGGVDTGVCRHAVQISVAPRDNSGSSLRVTAFILKKLTSYTPKYPVDLTSFSHLTGLRWADSDPSCVAPINLILGADLYNDIILKGLRKGANGEPMAQQTIFGWIVSSPIHPSIPPSPISSMHAQALPHFSVHHCLNSVSLENEIKKFWNSRRSPVGNSRRKLI